MKHLSKFEPNKAIKRLRELKDTVSDCYEEACGLVSGLMGVGYSVTGIQSKTGLSVQTIKVLHRATHVKGRFGFNKTQFRQFDLQMLSVLHTADVPLSAKSEVMKHAEEFAGHPRKFCTWVQHTYARLPGVYKLTFDVPLVDLPVVKTALTKYGASRKGNRIFGGTEAFVTMCKKQSSTNVDQRSTY